MPDRESVQAMRLLRRARETGARAVPARQNQWMRDEDEEDGVFSHSIKWDSLPQLLAGPFGRGMGGNIQARRVMSSRQLRPSWTTSREPSVKTIRPTAARLSLRWLQ
jgi:hypothetical protein